MLAFNPEHRYEAKKLLKSPIFGSVRSSTQEKSPSLAINLEEEKGIQIDYQYNKVVSGHNLVEVISNELNKIKLYLN